MKGFKLDFSNIFWGTGSPSPLPRPLPSIEKKTQVEATTAEAPKLEKCLQVILYSYNTFDWVIL